MQQNIQDHLWWQTGIFYQVYPRSYQDSNDDGVGDLRGIIARIGYLKELGVKAVWISPIYPSPMADFGYDISDYQGIWPLFGTMSDFDELLSQVHAAGMKLILDLVPNHTSDQHPWFLESRSSRDNPKRDWYIWHGPGPGGTPPNNWLSVFGGSAWEWDEDTGEFYYHAFLREQPDLNWRNPEVREAMLNVMRFWLDKGVDGFRVDVMWHMIKDQQLRDNPVNPDYKDYMASYERLLPVYSTDQPEVHEIVAKMRQLLDSYEERMMIGEIYLPITKLVTYYGTNNNGAHLPFNFLLISLPWEPKAIATAIDQYEGALPVNAWPNWVLGNHDQTRIGSRIGQQQGRIAAILLLTLRGTPTMYYGDEIGMRDVPIPAGEVMDPQGLNMPGKNLTRDPARTPMQWDKSQNAGFTRGRPWLRLDRIYQRENLEIQKEDPFSLYSLYRRLISIRQKEPALMTGNYRPVYSDRQIIAYLRQTAEQPEFLIIVNLTHRPAWFDLPNFLFEGTIEVDTFPEQEGTTVSGTTALSGDEGMIVRLHRWQPVSNLKNP